VNEPLQCEFLLVRYVPDPVKNEFVNIGVLLREAERPEAALVRFTKDWARVRCVDADADIAMLEAMETEMRRRLLETGADGAADEDDRGFVLASVTNDGAEGVPGGKRRGRDGAADAALRRAAQAAGAAGAERAAGDREEHADAL
jgi:hypothetical protein